MRKFKFLSIALILFVGMFLIIQSCQKDVSIDYLEKTNIKSGYITYEQFLNAKANINLPPSNSNNSIQRTETVLFSIDESKALEVISGDIIAHTFMVVRKMNIDADYENFVIVDNNGDLQYFIFEFSINDLNVADEATIKITELNYDTDTGQYTSSESRTMADILISCSYIVDIITCYDDSSIPCNEPFVIWGTDWDCVQSAIYSGNGTGGSGSSGDNNDNYDNNDTSYDNEYDSNPSGNDGQSANSGSSGSSDSNDDTAIGLFTNSLTNSVNDLADLLSIDVFSPDGQNWFEQVYYNLKHEDVLALIEFMDNNSNSPEAQEFVNEMIFHLERLGAPLITIETPEFQNEICAKQIKDDVISTLRIQKIISKFKPNQPVLHLEWGIFESTEWNKTGHTFLNDSQTSVIIELNKNSFDNITNIVLVQTIAHEIIHAELYRKLKELVDDYSTISYSEYEALENNYPGIADFVFRYGNIESTTFGSQIITWGLTPNYSLAHHNQMADYYRDVLIDTMKAYDELKEIDRGQNAEEFYEALSWMGLRSFSNNGITTYYDAWQQFVNQIDVSEANIPQDQRTYSRYENIIQSQINANPSTIGIGINCN